MEAGVSVPVAGRPLSDQFVSSIVFRDEVTVDADVAERAAMDRRRIANEDEQELFGSEYWQTFAEDGAFCATEFHTYPPAWFPQQM